MGRGVQKRQPARYAFVNGKSVPAETHSAQFSAQQPTGPNQQPQQHRLPPQQTNSHGVNIQASTRSTIIPPPPPRTAAQNAAAWRSAAAAGWAAFQKNPEQTAFIHQQRNALDARQSSLVATLAKMGPKKAKVYAEQMGLKPAQAELLVNRALMMANFPVQQPRAPKVADVHGQAAAHHQPADAPGGGNNTPLLEPTNSQPEGQLTQGIPQQQARMAAAAAQQANYQPRMAAAAAQQANYQPPSKPAAPQLAYQSKPPPTGNDHQKLPSLASFAMNLMQPQNRAHHQNLPGYGERGQVRPNQVM